MTEPTFDLKKFVAANGDAERLAMMRASTLDAFAAAIDDPRTPHALGFRALMMARWALDYARRTETN